MSRGVPAVTAGQGCQGLGLEGRSRSPGCGASLSLHRARTFLVAGPQSRWWPEGNRFENRLRPPLVSTHLATPETALSLLLKLRPRLQQQPAPTATVAAILPDLNCTSRCL
ncbi:PREDICTED: uncharacterized protein LOC108538101 isoform X2 [Rhinopithecus bieti]|uniref:uncharacterized protein LOC108538101 isoform X2 n=1 Tax=Rhinopithecus bieti TaxID=61621 RepID=UPI00083BB791|nr:PREDICTED: uncharacterized protein LOC108538101 isoform X2 [Rhinopithecus bieti]